MPLPSVEHLDEKTRNELAALSLALSGSRKTRKGFLGLVHEADPALPIPEIEQDQAIQSATKPLLDQIEKQGNELRDYKLQNDMAEKKRAVMGKYGLDDAAVKAMEEMMGKKELPADYEWAARLYQQQIQPVAPDYGTSGYGPVDLPSDEALMNDPDRWTLSSAHKLIDELRAKAGAKQF